MQRKIFLIFTTIAFSIIIGIFFILPLLTEIRDNSYELLVMREKIEEFHRKKDIARISGLYGEMNEFIVKTKTLFLEDTKPVGVLVLLSSISQSYNLETDISYIKNITGDEFLWPYMKFEVLLEGEVEDIFKFLKEIEVQEKLITVESFNIKEKKSGEDVKDVFTSKMVLRFFY